MSISWPVFAAEGDSDHEASAEEGETSKVSEAKQQIVETRPPVGALGSLLKGIQPDMTSETFSKLVERTEGLSDSQRNALNGSFRTVSNQVGAQKAGPEFVKVVGSALSELGNGDVKPPTAKTGEGEAQNPGQAAGNSEGGEKKVSPEFQALQDQLKKSEEAREALGRASLRDRERARGEGNGKGEGGAGKAGGGDAGGQPGGGTPNGSNGQGSGSGSGGPNGRALSELAKAFKNDNNKPASTSSTDNNSNNNNRNNQNKNNSRDDDRRTAARSSAFDSKPSSSSSSDSDSESTTKEKKKDENVAENNPFAPPGSNKPALTPYTGPSSGGFKSGGKSPLSAMNGGGWSGGGGFGGNFGMNFNGADAGGGLASLAGANVKGGGNGGGGLGGGSADLGSMRFDSDMMGGGGMGMAKAGGPIFGGGTGGDAGGPEVSPNGSGGTELADNGDKLRLIPNSAQVEFPVASAKGGPDNIVTRNYSKVVRRSCRESKPGQVYLCGHPRVRAWADRDTAGST